VVAAVRVLGGGSGDQGLSGSGGDQGLGGSGDQGLGGSGDQGLGGGSDQGLGSDDRAVYETEQMSIKITMMFFKKLELVRDFDHYALKHFYYH